MTINLVTVFLVYLQNLSIMSICYLSTSSSPTDFFFLSVAFISVTVFLAFTQLLIFIFQINTFNLSIKWNTLFKMLIFIVYILNALVILKVLYKNALHGGVRMRKKMFFYNHTRKDHRQVGNIGQSVAYWMTYNGRTCPAWAL